MREYVVENEFVKAVRAAGGVAYKLTSQTANGLPDRLVLFFPAKTVFVELKARFDEENNYLTAETMQQAGIKIIYSFNINISSIIIPISALDENSY